MSEFQRTIDKIVEEMLTTTPLESSELVSGDCEGFGTKSDQPSLAARVRALADRVRALTGEYDRMLADGLADTALGEWFRHEVGAALLDEPVDISPAYRCWECGGRATRMGADGKVGCNDCPNWGPIPPVGGDEAVCCASGRCEVCDPTFVWGQS